MLTVCSCAKLYQHYFVCTLRPFVKSCWFFNTVRPLFIYYGLSLAKLDTVRYLTRVAGREAEGPEGLLLIPLLLSLLPVPVRIVSFLNPES